MGDLTKFEVRYNEHSLTAGKWYVSGWPNVGNPAGAGGGYLGEDLNLHPSMVSPISHYVLTREEAETRLRKFEEKLTYLQRFEVKGSPWGFYVSIPALDMYVHSDLQTHPGMSDVKGKLHYLQTEEEAKERLKLFQEKNGMFGFGKKKEEVSPVPLTPFGEQRLQQASGLMTDEDYLDALGECEDEESDHVKNARATRHTQLLLEEEDTPTVTPIRTRLVTDGEDVILEVQTPSFGFYQSVARLSVNKHGQVVMYRTRRHLEDEFIKSDSQGRIQN